MASEHFELTLSDTEKRYLLDLAKQVVTDNLKNNRRGELHLPPTPLCEADLGAFVTLKIKGQLRGCIGRLVGGQPLYLTVADMAEAAAFQDPRFSPVRQDELAQLAYEISIMGPITPCKTTEAINIGRHGLIVKQGGKQGLLLPQVPVEWGWDQATFLSQTCRKAGLMPGAWKQAWSDDGTELYWFEAEVF